MLDIALIIAQFLTGKTFEIFCIILLDNRSSQSYGLRLCAWECMVVGLGAEQNLLWYSGTRRQCNCRCCIYRHISKFSRFLNLYFFVVILTLECHTHPPFFLQFNL